MLHPYTERAGSNPSSAGEASRTPWSSRSGKATRDAVPPRNPKRRTLRWNGRAPPRPALPPFLLSFHDWYAWRRFLLRLFGGYAPRAPRPLLLRRPRARLT